MGVGRRFVLRVQDDDRKTGRLACFLIEFAGDRLGVGQQQHGPRRLACAAYQIIALTVYGAKAGVLQFEQTVGDFRDSDRVAVIIVEDPNQLGRCLEAFLLVEKTFQRRPRKKVGMDNLVGVTTQEKLVRLTQGGENQLELDGGEVLHLVDHHEIVAWLDQGQVLVAHDVGVVIVVVL